MAFVSVVMPSYKAEAFIGFAVKSVLDQTHQNWELLVIDDCSPDRTSEAALEAANGDPRVRVIRAERNGGAPAARNIGIDHARGDWIAALDSDDAMDPERIATLMELAAEAGADIVADDLRLVPFNRLSAVGKPHVGFDVSQGPFRITLTDWVERNRVFSRQPLLGYHKPIFRADPIRRFNLRYNTSLKVSDDYFFSAEALAYGAIFMMHPRAMYRYAVRPGSLSRSSEGANTYSQLLGEYDSFIARHRDRLDESALQALARSRASLLDAEAWTGLAKSIKAGHMGRSFKWLAKRPAAIRHVGMPLRVRLERAASRVGYTPDLRMG